MNKKMKVFTIVGTRPEIIRLCEVIKACDKYFDHSLVHTGQNWDYTLNKIFFEELELREPDFHLESVGDNLGETLGNIISKSFTLFQKEKPDALLVLGDTNSCLSAISAKRLKIPIFHMEAGNRCFDLNVPEEINRKIVDHVSDVNLAYTEHSRRYLLQEGIRKEYTFVTGSPLTEVFEKYSDKIDLSNIITDLGLEKGKYFVISAHREENLDIGENFKELVNSLNAVAEIYKHPIIFSTHPRTQKKIDASGISFNKLIRNIKPLGFFDYNKLQKNSACVLSDSGTLSEESSLLGFPSVLIRTSTERPEVIEKGSIVVSGLNKDTILNSISIATTMNCNDINGNPIDYRDKSVSSKVVKIIASYTHMINKYVWMK